MMMIVMYIDQCTLCVRAPPGPFYPSCCLFFFVYFVELLIMQLGKKHTHTHTQHNRNIQIYGYLSSYLTVFFTDCG